jgi:hypothetical protein
VLRYVRLSTLTGTTEMTLPAGTYWVGDPCYVLHDRWDEVCDLTITEDRGCLDGEFRLKDGTVFAMYRTRHGDGAYRDQDNREYPVDSGTLGAVQLDRIVLDEENIRGIENGHVHEFPDGLHIVTGALDGLIAIGPVRIDTNASPSDEGEDAYDEGALDDR